MNNSLDEIIKAYSDELMRFAKENNIESLVIKKDEEENKEEAVENTVQEAEPTEEEYLQERDVEAEERDDTAAQTDEDEPDEIPPEEDVPDEIPPEEELENFALFKARVSVAFGAFAIRNAKVILYKNTVLHAFLVTDENGETQQIKIEAYPEENSLEPLSDEQRLDYSADVYAEGFAPQKNLLVSAVGGSDILLSVALVPESEGIS